MKNLYKLFYIISLFFVSNIHAQNNSNIYIYLANHKFIDDYIFIELSITNRNTETIYILKNYYIDEIIETNENIKFIIKSSWLSNCLSYDGNGELIWASTSMYHNPPMFEIRNNQRMYVSLLINIPSKYNNINKNKIINEIEGLKFSFYEYITEDISYAENPLEFYNGILEKINDLKYIQENYFNLLWN
jgi:hypothetical protein